MPSNPFFPGFGQHGAVNQTDAANPLMAGLDMMREAWASLAGAGGLHGLTQAAMPMNPAELDQRIAELRTVENWLRLNLSMLASSIQALEVQRATIATLKSFVGTAGSMAGGTAGSTAAASTTADSPAAASSEAAQQWWNLLQEQFNQLTQAAATSMQAAAATDAVAGPAAKKAARRTAKAATAKPGTAKPSNKPTNKPANKSTNKR